MQSTLDLSYPMSKIQEVKGLLKYLLMPFGEEPVSLSITKSYKIVKKGGGAVEEGGNLWDLAYMKTLPVGRLAANVLAWSTAMWHKEDEGSTKKEEEKKQRKR